MAVDRLRLGARAGHGRHVLKGHGERGAERRGPYLFPVASAVAVGAIGACHAFGRRWAPAAGTALVAGMMVFGGLCQLFVFTAYYA